MSLLPECLEVTDAQVLIARGMHAQVSVVRMFELQQDFLAAGMPEWATQAAGCAETACMREIHDKWP